MGEDSLRESKVRRFEDPDVAAVGGRFALVVGDPPAVAGEARGEVIAGLAGRADDGALAVDPRELPCQRAAAFGVGQQAGVRHREDVALVAADVLHAFDQRDRLAGELKPRQVELLGEQRPVLAVHQVPRLDVAGVRQDGQQQLLVLSAEL
jgi:hypothetical protein